MPSGKYTLSVNNRGSNRGTAIDLIIRGDEKLEIEYDGQLNSVSIPASKSLPIALDSVTNTESTDKWTADKRRVKNELTFQVRRDWNNKSRSGPLKLIPRPAVCIAKVTDPRGISYAIADHRIAEGYPPKLEFTLVLAQVPKSVRLDLWYCDNEKQLPGTKQIVPLSTSYKIPSGTLTRDANGTITVDLQTSRDDRVFVVCREASKAKREVTGLDDLNTSELTEKHVFTFDHDISEPAIYIVTENDLKNSSEIGHVYNLDFPLQ
jgi:hypothetical protein